MVSEKNLAIGILTGPTATGKTDLALQLAQRTGKIEIINADSLLVYRGMDIGTAKPSPQELQKIPHHLINLRDPSDPFTAADFVTATHQAISEIQNRGHRPLIVGGTGFYLKALLFGLWKAPAGDPLLREALHQKTSDRLFQALLEKDPISAQRIGSADRYRLIRALELIELSGKTPTELQNQISESADPRFHLWMIDRPQSELQDRIRTRTEAMLQRGLIDEYIHLAKNYPKARPLQAIGYAQVSNFLNNIPPQGRKVRPGRVGLQDEIELATRQLVKHQRTWFRNQSQKVSQSQWFILQQDHPQLEEAFNSVY